MIAACFQRVAKNPKLAKIEYEPGENRFARPIAIAPFVSSTYVSILGTCPDSCMFKNKGCYAQTGMTGLVVRKLDAAVHRDGFSHDAVIKQEAALISSAFKEVPRDGWRGRGRDLRLHVAGDCTSVRGARLLASAADTWTQKGGGSVWTYTHGWKKVHRKEWGAVSVLASCEDHATVLGAKKNGYVPSVVVSAFKNPNYFDAHGTRFIPCPAETRNKTCVECRLCLDDQKLARAGVGIAFLAHGQKKTEVKFNLFNLTQLRISGVV